MFIQPLPSYLSSIGQRNGGNILGLERTQSNAILWTTGVGVYGDDAAFAVALTELSAMTSRLENFIEEEKAGTEFVYMNYAGASQDPLGSYGQDNLAFMKDIANQYDPEGFWQKRVPGGFKLSRATSQSP